MFENRIIFYEMISLLHTCVCKGGYDNYNFRSVEYTGVQKENPAFIDEYTTIQSEIGMYIQNTL